nr:immunoglobulin heavy chain junction region [Macaca mulatta]
CARDVYGSGLNFW